MMMQINSVHSHPATSRDLIRQCVPTNHSRAGPRQVITDEYISVNIHLIYYHHICLSIVYRYIVIFYGKFKTH